MSGCLDNISCPGWTDAIAERRNLIASIVAGSLVGIFGVYFEVISQIRILILKAFFPGLMICVVSLSVLLNLWLQNSNNRN